MIHEELSGKIIGAGIGSAQRVKARRWLKNECNFGF
jgi:hypothetical protein